MERIELATNYTISRVIGGMWQLAKGHGAASPSIMAHRIRAYLEAGITTFDCADIYEGVEAGIGAFLESKRSQIRSGELPEIQIHTKCVPDLDRLPTLREQDVVRIVDRSLGRLRAEQLDLVQFHWWDYAIPGYVEAATWLADMQSAGKIRSVGVTNFDAQHLRELVEAGVRIVSNQVQYSALDRRPEHELGPLCTEQGISLLCYGTVAGGFLSEKYLGAQDPDAPLENRSLTKYRLIIEEFGGWDIYQSLLRTLASVASKHDVSLSMAASRYVMQNAAVGALIVGTGSPKHIRAFGDLDAFVLDGEDMNAIASAQRVARGPAGSVYGLERDKSGRHAGIIRHNIHEEGQTT